MLFCFCTEWLYLIKVEAIVNGEKHTVDVMMLLLLTGSVSKATNICSNEAITSLLNALYCFLNADVLS